MNRDIKKIISEMTLEEKAGLCSGLDFWHTKGVEHLAIPSIMMTDGPHGLRKQDAAADHLGLNESVKATCFPSGAGLACSWDRDLIEKVGIALGEECQTEDVPIILGPATNIKRSPLCGRNFEYFSEDPFLASEMAANHIKGVQSQGVGTSLKHFAANNQEHRRLCIDAVIDERTLREIYLASFEGAVKQSQPWTLMCAYNKVNNVYCSENKYLLTSILRDEWGFEGFVMSDWGAVNERVSGLAAGLELEMPSSNGMGDEKIVEAVRTETLSEDVLDKAVERLLKIIFKAADSRKAGAEYDKEAHHQLARKVASECMVLLKNEDNMLPISKKSTVAVIGELANKPRYQGGGSSHINPTKLDNALDEIKRAAVSDEVILYAKGFNLDKDDIDEQLVSEAKDAAAKADVAIIFAGLPDRYESEGYDREHMRIPENQNKLIKALSEVQKNIVVVLSNGSPIEMPWADKVKGILEGYLGGQAGGGAVADIIFGDANPCGKLAESFPKKLSDNPSYLNFPGEGDKVEYKEGIFVGYRYYDKKEIEPLFPFGHGLSYTKFEYTSISVDKKELKDDEILTVKVSVKNIGKLTGKEIVQLYVRDAESSMIRPIKELKAFEKIELKPSEEKIVTFKLNKRAFAYYNTEIKDWHVESGEFEILVGSSSKEILQRETVKVISIHEIKKKYTKNSTLGDIMETTAGAELVTSIIKAAFGGNPNSENDKEDNQIDEGFNEMLKGMLLRSMVAFSGGKFGEAEMNEFLEKLNNED
jgi:beta-glucosidase